MAAKATSPHISQITEYLYISAWPRGEHVEEIVAPGIHLVLSMHWMRPTKTLGHPPVKLLWLPTIDNPLFPMPIRTLEKGVRASLPVIQNGGSVLVHCKAGVHRSVAPTLQYDPTPQLTQLSAACASCAAAAGFPKFTGESNLECGTTSWGTSLFILRSAEYAKEQ